MNEPAPIYFELIEPEDGGGGIAVHVRCVLCTLIIARVRVRGEDELGKRIAEAREAADLDEHFSVFHGIGL